MIISFPKDVIARLRHIENVEGIPALDLVHQAVSVWSFLEGEERQRLGQVALGLVADRLRQRSLS